MGVKKTGHTEQKEKAPKGPPIIEVRDLVRTYPTAVPTLALRGVSFDVGKGEFLAIMGRSGSGKSTLMHQLGLLDTPTSGSITIGGTDILALNEKQKTRYRLEKMGHVFQEYALIAELTALENVYLPALALEGDHDEEHAKQLLGVVGLGDRFDHLPHELSGGEQQRVAIARALINEPDVVFADEPTANLDSESAAVVLELFKQLNKDLGQTIIMITHEPDDKVYVDRVIYLSDGLLAKEE